MGARDGHVALALTVAFVGALVFGLVVFLIEREDRKERTAAMKRRPLR
jgi:hypothetical protein